MPLFLKNIFLSSLFLIGNLVSNNINAQETINGQGTFRTINETEESIPGVNLSLRAQDMEESVPADTYQLTTNDFGEADFDIPVYTNVGVGIEELKKNDKAKIAPNFGGEMNAYLSRIQKGTVDLYDLNGRLVKSESFNSDHAYLKLQDLSNGMYVYTIRTVDGLIGEGKFMKDNSPTKKPSAFDSSSDDIKDDLFKGIEMYNATYWVKWDKTGYKKDSTLIDFQDGNNGLIELVIEALPNDTIWGEGVLQTINQEEMDFITNVSLTLQAEEMNDIMNETEYDLITNNNGGVAFRVPVYIGTNPENALEDIATYSVSFSKEGYYDGKTSLEFSVGDNGFKFVDLTPLPGIPQTQDIKGFVTNGDDNYSPIANASLILKRLRDGTIFTTTSADDGSFIFEDIPIENENGYNETDFEFSAGGIDGMFSYENLPYVTPDKIDDSNVNDTINDGFGVVLKYKNGLTAKHIKDQSRHGTTQDDIMYYLGESFTASQKEIIRGYFDQFKTDENTIYNFVESSSELDKTGINIEYGTYNTSTNGVWYETPFGKLSPVTFATTTMGVGDYITFVHEIKRALGLHEVGWNSVMNTNAIVYTQEDKDIATFNRTYWNSVYFDKKTNINLNYIVEDLSSLGEDF